MTRSQRAPSAFLAVHGGGAERPSVGDFGAVAYRSGPDSHLGLQGLGVAGRSAGKLGAEHGALSAHAS
jgi:hypothetical protein